MSSKVSKLVVTGGTAFLMLSAGLARVSAEAVEKTAIEQAKKSVVAQTTCPVMGGKINKNLYVEHEGKRIYVCCKGCIDAVTKSPAKYIEKLEKEGVTLEAVQTLCPVMGGKINKDLFVDVDGRRIYVCCKACIDEVKADPQKYIKKLEACAAGRTAVEDCKKAHEGCKLNTKECPKAEAAAAANKGACGMARGCGK